ncbi:hypothetical protein [Flindersiella endophytica]
MTEIPDPHDVIQLVFGAHIEYGHSYPGKLPADLAPWYAYFKDAGHSIIVALASTYESVNDPRAVLASAPVKAVLRSGWEIRAGFVVCDIPYACLRLLTEASDLEIDPVGQPIE